MPRAPLAGKNVLVTAGPTWVMIDAVRHIGNLSSGRTGIAIAEKLTESGAAVHLLLGPGSCNTPPGHLQVTRFTTFDELHALVREEVGSRAYDAVIHAAAVSDYRPIAETRGKIGSENEELVLRLTRTPKIVDEIKELDSTAFLVKFKLEVGRTEPELLRIARESGERSGADLVVANDLTEKRDGRHRAFILSGDGVVARVETTEDLARALVSELERRLPE